MHDVKHSIIATNWKYYVNSFSWVRKLYTADGVDESYWIAETFSTNDFELRDHSLGVRANPLWTFGEKNNKYLPNCFLCQALSTHPGIFNLDEAKLYIDNHLKEEHPHIMLVTDKTQCML